MDRDLNLVIVGHVDHGKSTVIGRLFADTDSLPEGKLDQVKENCRRNSKPFEYAFLLDSLKDEQSQGITIDSARAFFKTEKRRYIIIDAPGHIEFLKNMISGAARAEAALLVIDANEGVRENSKRHGYMLSMLGIKQIVILVNKMDLVNFDQKKFEKIKEEYTSFLEKINVNPLGFIPVSAINGDNISNKSKNMDWYSGKTVLEMLDVFSNELIDINKPFRMPVQDVYKFTKGGDGRRIVAGTVETGTLNVGDEVIFYPSGKKSIVSTIEDLSKNLDHCDAGYATGFTLEKQIYITRGELAVKTGELKPSISTQFKASIFWLGKNPLEYKKTYYLKVNTTKVEVVLEKVESVIDASTLGIQKKDRVDRHDVAECVFKTNKPIAFDLTKNISQTSRFVLVDEYEISGGGIITESIEDEQNWARESIIARNYKWESSSISSEKRAERYNQKPYLVIVTGNKSVGKKRLAKEVESKLFNEGKFVYYLGIGSLLYGVDADIKAHSVDTVEHLRRLGEVSNILLDAGVILVVTAIALSKKDVNLLKTSVGFDNVLSVWVGKKVSTDINYDLHFPTIHKGEELEYASLIKEELKNRRIVYNPW